VHRRLATLAVVATTLVLLAAGAACSPDGEALPPTTTVPDPPTIVVTTNILGDVVTNVVGADAVVIVLQPPDTDPTSVELTTDQARAVADADLVVANGLGLEAGMQDALAERDASGAPLVWVAPLLSPLPDADVTTAGEATAVDTTGDTTADDTTAGQAAGEAGDAGPRGDPHVWLDPDRMAAAGLVLAGEIAEATGLDPATLTARARAFELDVRAADEVVQATVVGLPAEQRTFVDVDGTMRYFNERYGFTDGPGPDVSTIRTVSLGPPGSGAETYVELLVAVADELVAAVQG